MTKLFREYRHAENKRIAARVVELETEAGIEGRVSRVLYLNNHIDELVLEIETHKRQYEQSAAEDMPYIERALIARDIPRLEKELRKFKVELRGLINPKSKRVQRITDEMIANARDYPLDNILDINSSNFALCIEHDDRRPSMYCKNNYAHCFSCAYQGDAIAVMQKVKGVSFIEAIEAMQ